MRWLYADPNRPDERRHIEATVARIDEWWLQFAKKTADLDALFSRKAEWDLPHWMGQHLQAILTHRSRRWVGASDLTP